MIPKFHELFLPLLKYLGDGKKHSLNEAKEYLENYFHLSDEEKNKLLPSGKQTVLRNRLGWAKTYLNKARLIDIPQRGYIMITKKGIEVLKEKPDKIDVEYLKKFPEFVGFINGINHSPKHHGSHESDSPEEVINQKVEEINSVIKDELFDKVINSSPQFFEKLVLDLVVSMGYGGSFEEVSQLLGKSGDEGVDGVIKQDVLGLDNIYLQAKRWKEGSVGRPVIQSFVGALHGKGAKKGIFITTSTFTKGAREYAKSLKDMSIILIDRDQLLSYMLKYNIGVEEKETIKIKKVNDDYFEDF